MTFYLLCRSSPKVIKDLTTMWFRSIHSTSTINRSFRPARSNAPTSSSPIQLRSFSEQKDRPEFGEKLSMSWLAYSIPPFLVLCVSCYHLLHKPEHGLGMLKRPWRYQKGVFNDICCKEDECPRPSNNSCPAVTKEDSCPKKENCCRKKDENVCKINECKREGCPTNHQSSCKDECDV